VSTYYALRDTKTPLTFAGVRIALTTVLGLVAVVGTHWSGIDLRWGAVGLTASAGVAGWIEFVLLRRGLTARIGRTGLRARYVATLWLAALGAAALASGWRFVPWAAQRYVLAALALGTFGIAYLLFTVWLNVPAAAAMAADLRRRFRVG
jgi:putative peptidoglycan lipid II flippase